ncbi:predicted protein [Arabidopsis lyrata subsp. lyrata]|uniref:Predicted protein n=1 Tax=Arabidopsis lyrata subsp. lyrata TaxID=81972 RepID=D7L8R3_ARALL|nr:predicted protein [Arabidopsis lyrata subsp. lyrata]
MTGFETSNLIYNHRIMAAAFTKSKLKPPLLIVFLCHKIKSNILTSTRNCHQEKYNNRRCR